MPLLLLVVLLPSADCLIEEEFVLDAALRLMRLLGSC
jgi:hypothetical protein